LDMVTLPLSIVPLTVEVFDGLGIDPIPFLIAELLPPNLGRIATMVGDPTNVIIGSSPLVKLSFNQFLFNTAPIALAILAANSSILYLRNHGFLHRDAMNRHRNRGPLQLPNP